MLDITGDDIEALTDTALSGLLERLCQAELDRQNLMTTSMTLGGAQDAPDGGVDLRIDTDPKIADSGWVPRAHTIFQAKATPMPAGKVVAEMRPKGVLRPAIAEVLAMGGAYVIACSRAAPAGPALASIRAKMRKAAEPDGDAPSVVDFYGSDRLALWCRSHPGIIAWALRCAGRPLQGWRPFENWAAPADRADWDYIRDDEARLIDERVASEGPITVEAGIERMRALAHEPQSAVRLVGLSGVGKTRLVQALFDDRVGALALSPHLALYCDAGAPVSPDPIEMARQLVDRSDRVVLVVDNCSPELHRRVSDIATSDAGKVSLISVEYDVREDDMEGAEVFRLEPASHLVTEHLVKRHYPHISAPDRRRIADIAGGNARVARNLAHTVRRGESLGQLRDDALFERLFHQRNRPDPSLLAMAEIAALVYSFDGVDERPNGELATLAGLAGRSSPRFRMAIRDLTRRDLVQHRSQWRAVLPHAVANRLAALALDAADAEETARAIEAAGPRLLRSFTRRLTYLHNAPPARRLAEAWFSPGGRLGSVEDLGRYDFDMFRNLAPLAPAAALAAISEAAGRDPAWRRLRGQYGLNYSLNQLSELLRALAFDAALFDEAVARLVELRLRSSSAPPHTRPDHLTRLFKLYFSGAMALPEQRLTAVRALLDGPTPERVELGFSLLDTMLETEWFSRDDGVDFGARPRGSGWLPKDGEAAVTWYAPVLRVLTEDLRVGSKNREAARDLLVKRFRQLWTGPKLTAELTEAMDTATAEGFWPRGWVAVRSTFRYVDEDSDRTELLALEARLRPQSLVEKMRVFGATDIGYGLDLGDLFDDQPEDVDGRIESFTRDLAEALARDLQARSQVLPVLLQVGVQRHWMIGEGLALGAADRGKLWDEMVSTLRALAIEVAEPGILRSYLSAWWRADPLALEEIFETLLHDPFMGRWFPFFQSAVMTLSSAAIARLKRSLDLGFTRAGSYHVLQFGRTMDDVPPAGFADIVRGVAQLEDGHAFAVEIFHMRVHTDRKRPPVPEEILALGRDLLRTLPFRPSARRSVRYLDEIAKLCLAGSSADGLARDTLRRIGIAVRRYEASEDEWASLLDTVIQARPQVALNLFLVRDYRPQTPTSFPTLFFETSSRRRPLASIPVADIQVWVAKDRVVRCGRLAPHVALFHTSEEGSTELSPQALALLRETPDPTRVLKAFEDNVTPRSWSGSREGVLEHRAAALQVLDDHPLAQVRDWARKVRRQLADEIAAEASRFEHQYQAFE